MKGFSSARHGFVELNAKLQIMTYIFSQNEFEVPVSARQTTQQSANIYQQGLGAFAFAWQENADENSFHFRLFPASLTEL